MKNFLLLVLAATTIALAAFCVSQRATIKHQAAQLSETQARLAARETELKEKTEAFQHAKFLETKADVLQKTLSETAATAAEQSRKSEKLAQSLAAARTNNPLQAMAAMFKDPKMRDLIKSQQKAFMGPMIDKQYAALFQQLGLSSEQSGALKELLQNKMLAGADAGLSMLDDSVDADKRAELSKQMKAQADESNNQIKQLLGDENYQAFQDYEKLAPDRMAVSQFGDQLSSGEMALSAEQQSSLTQALNDARNGFHWTADLNQRSSDGGADILGRISEENISRFEQERAQFDEQFLTRAGQILNPQQLAAYRDFQAAQRQLQIMGLRMTAQMLAPKN